MNAHLSTILDKVLARLEAGESVGMILADYPSHSEELTPLLEAAQDLALLRDVPTPAEPDVGLAAFLDEAGALRSELESRRPLWRRLTKWLAAFSNLGQYPGARLAAGSLVALILLFGLIGGTVSLAADSLPGDWLYPIKLSGEEIRLSFTFDQGARAEYHLARATTRAGEILQMAQADRPIDEVMLERMDRSLEASLLSVASADLGEMPRLLVAIEEAVNEHAALLTAASATAATDRNHHLLTQAQLSLAQAGSLARAGRADVHTFHLNARLGILRVGRPSPASSEIGLPTATVTPAPTSDAQPTAPTATATTRPAGTPTLTGSVEPSRTPTPSRTPKPSRTPGPSSTPTSSPTSWPSYTPQSPTPTNTQLPTPTRTQPPTPTNTQPPPPTSTPHPPAPTNTPQPPAPTSTRQPPGQTNTPQPPGQTKAPKPTKKP